jgi:hypothetical protein
MVFNDLIVLDSKQPTNIILYLSPIFANILELLQSPRPLAVQTLMNFGSSAPRLSPGYPLYPRSPRHICDSTLLTCFLVPKVRYTSVTGVTRLTPLCTTCRWNQSDGKFANILEHSIGLRPIGTHCLHKARADVAYALCLQRGEGKYIR